MRPGSIEINRCSRPEVFCKKNCCCKFPKILREKHLCWSLLLNSCRPQAYNWIKKRLQHMFFPVNFSKFFRTPFSIEHPGGCFWIEGKIGAKFVNMSADKKHVQSQYYWHYINVWKLFTDNSETIRMGKIALVKCLYYDFSRNSTTFHNF